MKLFVWDKGFLEEWQSGIAVAVAETADGAREAIISRVRESDDVGEAANYARRDLARDPDHVHDLDDPVAYYLWGSS